MKKAKQLLLVLLAICMVMCHAFVLTAVVAMFAQDDITVEPIEFAENGEELQPMATSGCENDYPHIFDNPQHNLTPFFEQLWRKSSGCIWCCIVSWTVLCDSGVYKRCNKCL